jgi:hypothetical protein
VIYEITGISDILRGATQASETATAQQIKNQWGTLRLKRMQGEVARYIRDLLRLMLELAATKLSEETWAKVTGLPFVTSTQRQQLEMQAQMIAASGQPLPPPLQQQLAQPVWAQILELLKDDTMRAYRIDIETNSTVEPEAAEDQKAIADLLGMLGQYLNGVGPLVAKGVMPFEAAQSMMLAIARRFRFGQEIEDSLKAMKPPPPENDGKEAEMQMKQLEMQKQQATQEVQFKQKQSEMALQEKAMQAEMEHKQREIDLQMREMALQAKEQQFGMQQQVEKTTLDMQKQHASNEIGMKQKVADLENKRYKTENAVNQKADTALGQGLKSMQGLVEQLVKAVGQQAADNQRLVDAVSKPRVKKAVRGRDGRIERVEEEVMA